MTSATPNPDRAVFLKALGHALEQGDIEGSAALIEFLGLGDAGTEVPLLDTGGYLNCGCHGSQRDHTCTPDDGAQEG
jgi:hypothetical protein